LGPGRADTNSLKSDPVIYNLHSGQAWIPWPEKPGDSDPQYGGPVLPRWSDQLGVMIAHQSEDSLGIYDPDGNLLKSYPGTLLGIAPSAKRILMSTNTWIDLASGRSVHFAWQAAKFSGDFGMRPIWSADEMRVYTCCYHYGDAATGASLDMPYDHIRVDGKEIDNFEFYNFHGTWVLGGKYLLSQWNATWDEYPGFIPLFDPAAKTYRDLGVAPEHTRCSNPSVVPGDRYIWLVCLDGNSYLVDLVTFKSHTYPDFFSFGFQPSPDGEFILVSGHRNEDPMTTYFKILSPASGELKPAPQGVADWAPGGHLLFSFTGGSFSLIDARTLAVQRKIDLPIEARSISWSPDERQLLLWAKDGNLWQMDYPALGNPKKTGFPAGYQIIDWSPDESRIVLRAGDNSLWLIDYPGLEHLEQLTPALPGWVRFEYPVTGSRTYRVDHITWSPDGNSLAFISDADVYVVDVKRQAP